MNCIGTMNDGIYNCYGKIDTSMCYDCIYNKDSTCKKQQNNFISFLDKVKVLYDYLRGEKLPDGVECAMPKLSANKAFSVIWFLQEIMQCLPGNIEQCKGCAELFDTDSEGYCLSDDYTLNGKTLPKKYWGHWCNNCVPYVDFELK